MNTNMQRAKALAAKHWQEGRLPFHSSGAVGEDSDFVRRYWRIGGNAVVYDGVYGLEALRWHDFVRATEGLKIRIEYAYRMPQPYPRPLPTRHFPLPQDWGHVAYTKGY